METINIQCGHCRQLMAVSTAHLGMQVHCPHCQQIVQLPGAAPPGGADMQNIPEINVPPPPIEPESIFTGPEEGPSDDLFGAPQRLVEMPAATPMLPPSQLPGTPAAPSPGNNPYGLTESYNPVPAVDHQGGFAASSPLPAPADEGYQEAAAPGETSTPSRPRASADRSMRIPILLIFLIPYSVVATGFIAWLWYLNSKRIDPLLWLLDPDKNPPKRIQHDAPVPQGQKIKLNEAIVVGELEVTPQKVELSSGGELVLHLKMRNKSQDLRFNPLPQSFLDFNPNIMTAPKPYTFLQVLQPPRFRFYGGNLDYWKGNPGQGQTADGVLNPGQEMIALLHTKNDLTSLKEVKKLKEGRGNLLWRVQVRRGLMPIGRQEVSVTTVIGVEFEIQHIQHAAKGAG